MQTHLSHSHSWLCSSFPTLAKNKRSAAKDLAPSDCFGVQKARITRNFFIKIAARSTSRIR
jgi:hypothetical protein